MNMTEKVLCGTPIHYWIGGAEAGSAILFLHPAFADHTCFDEQTAYFAAEYRIIAVDILGHGTSLGRGSLTDMARWLDGILEAENIEKVNVVGVSLGAVLAQDFANFYPNRIASLCCIGGYDINRFDAALQKENGGAQMKMMMKAMFSVKWFAKDNKKISAYTESAQEKFYQMNLRFRKSSFRYLASLGKMVNRCEPPVRDYPLMIGVGEHDAPSAKKASALWHEREVSSMFKVFAGAGHLVNMDVPEQFNMELKKILG